jgi:hypothetical protein
MRTWPISTDGLALADDDSNAVIREFDFSALFRPDQPAP